MDSSSEANVSEANVEVKTFPIRVRNRGQITVPQSVRDTLDVAEGDILTLIQINDLILLTPKQPQVPGLADQITSLMDEEGISLADLLAGLEEERHAIPKWVNHPNPRRIYPRNPINHYHLAALKQTGSV